MDGFHGRIMCEEELVKAASAGDRAAFEILARRWWARIGKFCAASVGFDERLADEAAQDALLGLYRALPRFRRKASLATFVYRICRNASIDIIRRNARHRARVVPLPDGADETGDALNVHGGGIGSALCFPGPEDEFLRKEADMELGLALSRLKSDERALVYLREAEGLGIGELAAIFGLPEGTVKSRLSRIRAKLAEMLKEESHGRK